MPPNLSLARSRAITHPVGVELTTPLLVPSFSSKGFPRDKNGVSWIRKALDITSEWLTDIMLISAYDLHYEEIPEPRNLDCTPEITIVDSGGYEAGFDQDVATPVFRNHQAKSWTVEQLIAAYRAWPEGFPAILVSYDHPGHRVPFAKQVEAASSLLGEFSGQMHSLLLKPETDSQNYLTDTLKAVANQPSLLKGFDVIGVTEKELGSNLLQRMQRLAQLRRTLDDAGVTAPIQVFGALDPISACLYFLAGGEIFDGLTWLRYAYHEGQCVYRANYGALQIGLDRPDQLVDAKTMTDNINRLRDLEMAMRRVVHDNDIMKFPYHQQLFSRAFDDLRVKIGGER